MTNRIILVCCLLFTLSFAQQSLLQNNPAANYLPKDAFLLVAANDPETLFDKLGRENLILKHQAFYDVLVHEMTKEIGHNLLDPNTLRELGANPNGAVGFSFIRMQPEQFAFYVSLNDANKAKETVLNFANRVKEPMNVEQIGDAILLDPTNESGNKIFFIIRGNFLFFFGIGGPWNHPEEEKMSEENFKAFQLAQARAFAQTSPADSLGSNPRFQKINQKLNFGKDAALYLDLSRILDEMLKDMENSASYDNTVYLQKQIKDLEEQLKANPEENSHLAEEIEYLQKDIEREKEWQQERKQRAKKEMELVKQIAGGVEALVAGAELMNASIQVKSFVQFNETSIFSKMFQNIEGFSPFINALYEQPIILASGKINVASILQVIGGFSASEGMPLDQLFGMIKQEFNIDLKDEFLPLLTGEAGFAVCGQLSGDRIEETAKALNINAAIRLTDGVKGQEILTRLASHPQFGGMLQKNEALNGYSVPIPEWKQLHIAIIQDHLVFSTDPEFCRRLQSGEVDSFTGRLSNLELRGLFQTPNAACHGLLDLSFFATLMLRSFGGRYTEPGYPQEATAHSNESANSEAPFSEAYKEMKSKIEALENEVSAINKTIRTLEQKENELSRINGEEENRVMMGIFSKIGIISFVARVEPDGISYQGGLFVNADSVSALVDYIVENVVAMEEKQKAYYSQSEEFWKKTDELRQKQDQLREQKYQFEEKLQEIRNKDIEDYNNEKK